MSGSAEIAFGRYRLTRVYRQIEPALATEIARLWLDQAVVDPYEAHRRIGEVFFIIRSPDGALAGVDTVYLQPMLGEPWWFLRMFLRPEDRGAPGLARFALSKTFEQLAAEPVVGLAPRGVAMVFENPRLTTAAAHRGFARAGWRLLGQVPPGQELWYLSFDGRGISPGG